MSGPTIDDIEKKVRELARIKVFDVQVNEDVQSILKAIPPIQSDASNEEKTRLTLLKCKAMLIIPTVSKDVEQDLQSVLKLMPTSVEAWIDLSECYLRRSAYKDAVDALDSALKIDGNNTEALCKLSQVQRNRCGESGLSTEQKKIYFKDSVDKAHAAVTTDLTSSEAWFALALALLSQLTVEKMTYGAVKRAYGAIQKAHEHSVEDPDVTFNKGVIEGLLGYFGLSAISFAEANKLDSVHLPGSKQLCEVNVSILRRSLQRIKSLRTIGKVEYKKLLGSVNNASRLNPSHVSLVVVDLLTESAAQPLCLLALQPLGEFCFVLVYNVSLSSFRVGQLLTFSASERIEVSHKVPLLADVEYTPVELCLTHHYVAPEGLKINGKSLPASSHVSLQMSSRLFA